MPSLLPPGFPTRLDLIHRISAAPLTQLTPPRPWAPLSNDEWAHLAPYLAAHGCGLAPTPRPGRPPVDTRARLDAIFRAVSLKGPRGGRGAWSLLPAEHGKPDTVSRSFRRWAHANLWARLLAAVAGPGCPAPLRRLTWLICCAFRRATRIMGLRAILLARRLGLYSALPAPAILLPDPDLSESLWPVLPALLRRLADHPGWRPPPGALRGLAALHRLCAGRRRVARWMEPA